MRNLTDPQSISILLIDDNVCGLETMKLLLELEGHSVYSAISAEDGVALFKTLAPSVVILDIGLPGVDGWALAKTLRTLQRDKHLLLIALTGRGAPSDLTQSIDSGCDAHLVKPASIDDISCIISKHFLESSEKLVANI